MPRHLQRLLRWRRGTGIMCHSTATIHGMSCSVVSNGSSCLERRRRLSSIVSATD